MRECKACQGLKIVTVGEVDGSDAGVDVACPDCCGPAPCSHYVNDEEGPFLPGRLMCAECSEAELRALRAQLAAAEKMAEAAKRVADVLARVEAGFSPEYEIRRATEDAWRAALAEWDKERGTR